MKVRAGWWGLYTVAFALPAVLLYSSALTYFELDAQRAVYLRNLAAAVAGRLDTAGVEGENVDPALASILDEEPHLRALHVAAPAEREVEPGLDAVWSGRELFHTEFVGRGPERVYRAWVPFHTAAGPRVARIDLDPDAAEFLMVHARQHIVVSSAAGVVLLAISLYSIRVARQAAARERDRLQMEHLARLGTMSAVLAHEIRNPLGAVKGFAQLAIEQGGDRVRTLLTPVVEQVIRLEALVNDLLVYGRPPSPKLRPVPPGELSRRIAAQADRLAAATGVEVRLGTMESTLETDPDLLEQIVVNLLRNAVDAVDQHGKGRVEVASSRTGKWWTLEISDNGPGISPEHSSQVREPFFTTKASGTGLGLPISIRLAEALGGAIAITSRPGEGTSVTVRLPATS